MGCLNQVAAARLAKALPEGVKVRVEPVDYGNSLGAAVELPDGKRHAVRVRIENCDITAAADLAALALADWIENP